MTFRRWKLQLWWEKFSNQDGQVFRKNDISNHDFTYRISANSFRGNYFFLSLTLCTVTFGYSTYRCGNYSREETIQGRKLFAEIRYLLDSQMPLNLGRNFPISFKPNVAIAEFFWKMQKKPGIPFWGWTPCRSPSKTCC